MLHAWQSGTTALLAPSRWYDLSLASHMCVDCVSHASARTSQLMLLLRPTLTEQSAHMPTCTAAGSDSRQQVLVNTVPAMVAWFTQQLQQQAPAAALRYKQGPARLAAAAALAGSAALSPTTQVAMATAGMPLACEAAAGLRLASWQQQGSGGRQSLLGALLPARVLPAADGGWERQEAQEVRGLGDGWRGAVGLLRLPSVDDVKHAFDAWLKASEAAGEVSFSTK
jgi:hypothetical protein